MRTTASFLALLASVSAFAPMSTPLHRGVVSRRFVAMDGEANALIKKFNYACMCGAAAHARLVPSLGDGRILRGTQKGAGARSCCAARVRPKLRPCLFVRPSRR